MLDRLQLGDVPKKHHIKLLGPDGALRFEECLTRDGFEGPYTILYHTYRPHEQRTIETTRGWSLPSGRVPLELKKRHFRSQDVRAGEARALDARVPLLFNQDVTIGVAKPKRSDDVYFVNGDGDELLYIHAGRGTLRSILGDVPFEADDYLYVPKGVLHRFDVDESSEQYWLTLECHGGVGIPQQWRNPVGQLRMDAPYSHRDFRRPTHEGPRDEGIREVVVLRGGRFHTYALARSPLDVVGWDGSVYPFAFPILNFQPRAGLVHLPPTWHGTFAARGALICSFVPRVLDFHEDAIPCPYPHTSVDIDEVIFYARGNFTSRKGVGSGSLSFHPAGIPHGPHPGAYEASIGVKRTDELAVMLDLARPVSVAEPAHGIEDLAYHDSFIEG